MKMVKSLLLIESAVAVIGQVGHGHGSERKYNIIDGAGFGIIKEVGG